MKIYCLILAIASISFTDNCEANPVFGGFASQSWVKTTDVKIAGNSDAKFGSLSRTEIGAFGTYDWTNNISFRGMISSFREGGYSNGTVGANYALVDLHTEAQQIGIRIGKVSHSSGFYTGLINVPSFRDLEIPPQSLYRDGLRNFSHGGDGFQLYSDTQVAKDWRLCLEYTKTRPDLTDQAELNKLLFILPSVEFIPRSTLEERSVKLVGHNFMIRYDRDKIDLAYDYPMHFKSRKIEIVHRFGVRRYFTAGDITAEYNYYQSPDHTHIQPTSYDIVYRHYLTDKLTLILGYDAYFSGRDDKNGTMQSALFQQHGIDIVPEAFYSKAVSIGLKYKPKAITYRAEVHAITGTSTAPASSNDITKLKAKRYSIVVLNATYSF